MCFWDGIGDIIAILDTKNLIWETRSSIGAPNIGLKSATTLLSNNKIIYIDSSASSLIKVSKIIIYIYVYIYDIVNDTWSTKITSGTMPPKRLGASAVLGLDGQRVIIYGGSSDAKPVDSSLYELNLINYEWRIPKTSGKTPASRTSHRANVIGKYMVISFGLGYNESEENDILLLDISNKDEYIWTNEYDPSSSNISAQIIKRREFVESSNNENIHNHGQEIVEPLSNERIFNHGREINLSERSKTETNNKVPLSMNKFRYDQINQKNNAVFPSQCGM
ncbi:unnamed protein product [Rhizophagus irregularis]|nr:unnamed protein product [Rhizophagus irregularis]